MIFLLWGINMKKIVVLMISVMLLSLLVPPISAYSNDIENKQVDEVGQAKFGLLLVLFTSANGIPEEDFNGMIRNVKITFSGETNLGIGHFFPLIHPPDIVFTSDDLNVKIDFFYGMILYRGNQLGIIAFVKGIQWSTVAY